MRAAGRRRLAAPTAEHPPPARPSPKQVTELEELVCVACAKGVEASRCREVIEDAVRRARRKGAMLQHLDSTLLLSTLAVSEKSVRPAARAACLLGCRGAAEVQ